MDKAQVKVIHEEVSEAIRTVYAKHGLTITSDRASYGEAEFNISVKAISTKAEDQAKTWAQYAPVYGLPVDGFGQLVTINRQQYVITGLDLNRRGYVVRVKNLGTGKVSLFKADAIRRALALIDISSPA